MSVIWNPALIDGPIVIPNGWTDTVDAETGETYRVPTSWRSGYRLNTTAEALTSRPDLETYRVDPPRLARVWAGDDPENPVITVALLFADEAEAMSVLGSDFMIEEGEDA